MSDTPRRGSGPTAADSADGVRIGESPVPGLTLRAVLRGHEKLIARIAWSPDGRYLASPSADGSIWLWDSETGVFEMFRRGAPDGEFMAVAWSPDGRHLAALGHHNPIWIWSLDDPSYVARPSGSRGFSCYGLSWSPDGVKLAGEKIFPAAGAAPSTEILEARDFETVYDVEWSPDGDFIALGVPEGARILRARTAATWWRVPEACQVYDVDWSPDRRLLAIAYGANGNYAAVVDIRARRRVVRLEGHTEGVNSVSFSSDGSLLVSKSSDDSVRFWRCDRWELVATLPEVADPGKWLGGLAFHPRKPMLATLGEQSTVIRIWDVDVDQLLRQRPASSLQSTRYTTARIVIAGDSGVGKTGLGFRLAHGEFKEQSSTHGQQFWVLDSLGTTRADGTQCEAILWDLAGQQDYRIIHALFLDDADVALVLFDPTDSADPLHGVEFWLKHLRIGEPNGATRTILVAARTDRGSPTLMPRELQDFCAQRGLQAYVATSARLGDGIDDLLAQVRALIPWDDKVATVTTETFKRVKDYVLSVKEHRRDTQIIVATTDLRRGLEQTDAAWRFTDAELLVAVGHVENHGYVKRLRASSGEIRVLLTPEVLNNLAASIVLEARRNPKGLGSLDERQLLDGQYHLRELDDFDEADRRILLDSAVLLFIEHNVCFRGTDPLTMQSYLVFPDLINLKKPPLEDEEETEDGPSYTVRGAVQNVYASLVVLMGYTRQLTRTNQWQNQARYEIGNGLLCGFRAEGEREGEQDFVLYFGKRVGSPVRTFFQSLFESFLARHDVTVTRFDQVACPHGHSLDRNVVRKFVLLGKPEAFCSECGTRVALRRGQPVELTTAQADEVASEQRTADARTRFEQAVFQLQTYVQQAGIAQPECFISYAWGIPEHEHWVEHSLATDLKKAGLPVLLDRWDNARIGASVSRFVERIPRAGRVLVVGSPLYRHKYENKKPMGGYVGAAEGDLIGERMLGSEERKLSVLPLLLDGYPDTALPPLLTGRVYADFREPAGYFSTIFDLMLSLYEIPVTDPAVSDARTKLKGNELRGGAV